MKLQFSTLDHAPEPVLNKDIPPKQVEHKPLRVAIFSGNYNYVRDGCNRALNQLVGYLLAVGIEVRIYSPTGPRPSFPSVGDVVSVPSVAIPGRSEYRLALGLPRSIRKDLAAFSPDIIHLSAPDWLGRSAQRYARREGIAVLASLHTRFETYLEYYGLGILRGPLERYLDRFYGNCDQLLAPTKPIAYELTARHGHDRISIWSRGVERSSFHPCLRDDHFRRVLGYASEEVVPLFFGRLVFEKGLQVFLDAIIRVRAAGYDLRPLIVGDGPARSWLAEQLPDANFLGHLEGAALGRAVASADVLINPSVTEAFGNVNLEAMASGLPIISADTPSASTLIKQGQTGLLVDPGNAEAYAAALLALITDPARRRVLGQAASLAADAYDWNEILADVVEAYRHCVENNPALR